jgi:hypothetical protein
LEEQLSSMLRDIGRLALVAHFDAMSLVRRMWPTLLAVAALIVVGLVVRRFLRAVVGTELGKLVAGTLVDIAVLYFCAPFVVALVHSVVNDKATSARQFRGTDNARLYFAWAAVLAFVALVPGLLFELAHPLVPPTQPLFVFEIICGVAFAWVIAVRTPTLLPGVAIEGRAMTLGRALLSTRGRFWYITAVFLAVSLAPALILSVLWALASGLAGVVARIVFSWVFLLAAAVLVPLLAIVGLTLSSRLYQLFVATGSTDA